MLRLIVVYGMIGMVDAISAENNDTNVLQESSSEQQPPPRKKRLQKNVDPEDFKSRFTFSDDAASSDSSESDSTNFKPGGTHMTATSSVNEQLGDPKYAKLPSVGVSSMYDMMFGKQGTVYEKKKASGIFNLFRNDAEEDFKEFYQAARDGRDKDVQRLMDHSKIDVNRGDSNWIEYTALHRASIQGHANVVQTLFGHPDLDVNKTDSFGRTALHIASEHGNSKVVEKLLSHSDIDVTIKDNKGLTALDEAKRPISIRLISMRQIAEYDTIISMLQDHMNNNK